MSKNLIIENLKKQLSKGTKIIYFMKKESKDSGKLVRSTIPSRNGAPVVPLESVHHSCATYGSSPGTSVHGPSL